MRHLSALATEIICARRGAARRARAMASVNYRRRAGNLIDRDKRSNCRGARARPARNFSSRGRQGRRAELISDITFTESGAPRVNRPRVEKRVCGSYEVFLVARAKREEIGKDRGASIAITRAFRDREQRYRWSRRARIIQDFSLDTLDG